MRIHPSTCTAAAFVAALASACGGALDEHTHNDQCACGAIGTMPIADDSADDSEISTTSSALYGRRTAFWPAAQYDPAITRTDINVCWENPESTSIGSTSRARSSWRDARRRAVEVAWSRHARINFYGWGTCPSGANGLRIVLCDMGDNDPRCPAMPKSQAGANYPQINGLANGIRINPASSAPVMVHEFGHALGFYHSEERYNPYADLGTVACEPSQSGWTNNSPVSYGAYDEGSIMAYCDPPDSEPWLSTTDVAGIQRAYGRRISGSLVTPRGHCAAAHAAVGAGDHAFLWECDEFADDQEYHDVTTHSNGDTFNLRLGTSPLCLAKASYTTGAPVELATCSVASTHDDWRLQDMYVVGFGGLCLDLEAGNTNPGTKIQLWQCGALGGANQKWKRTESGLLRYNSSNRCARMNPSTNRLELAYCNAADTNQVFLFGNHKIQMSTYPFNCLDVVGPSDADFAKNNGFAIGKPSNGNVIQAYTCNSSMNQRWHFSGAIRSGGNSSQCLARPRDGSGVGLSVEACDGNDETQTWDYYF